MQKVSGVESLKSTDYTVMPEQTTKIGRYRVWLLFIPIFWYGPSKGTTQESKAYQKMIKMNDANGVIDGKYVCKKWCIPLIALNFDCKTTTLTGRPYKLNINKPPNDTIK